MKNTILLTIVLFIFSCGKNENPEGPSMSNLDDISLELIESSNEFSFGLLQNVVQSDQENENIFISPLSVSLALAMTYNGAEGETKTAFENVLGYDGLDRADINESYKALINTLLTIDNKVEMQIANSIWYRQEYSVLQPFIDVNEQTYKAGIKPTDFSNPSTLDQINGWIEGNTNGKIKDMLDQIPAEAFMYLINAIYFDGTWKYEFDEAFTQDRNFYPNNGAQTGPVEPWAVPAMMQQGTFNYANNEMFASVEMPYGNGDFSMVILLPNGDHSTSDILESLNSEKWDTWMNSFEMTENVQIQVPKLKLEYGTKLLNDELINMGLGIAFDPSGANFSGIRKENDLFISRVLHKTFIDMNEAGTEAAAATIVEMKFNAVPDGDIPEITFFHVNKPYLLFIKEKETNAILFAGRINKPVV